MSKQVDSFYFGLAGLIVTLVASVIFRLQLVIVALPLSYIGAGLSIASLIKVRLAFKAGDVSNAQIVGIVFAVLALLLFIPFLLMTYVVVFGINIGW